MNCCGRCIYGKSTGNIECNTCVGSNFEPDGPIEIVVNEAELKTTFISDPNAMDNMTKALIKEGTMICSSQKLYFME